MTKRQDEMADRAQRLSEKLPRDRELKRLYQHLCWLKFEDNVLDVIEKELEVREKAIEE